MEPEQRQELCIVGFASSLLRNHFPREIGHYNLAEIESESVISLAPEVRILGSSVAPVEVGFLILDWDDFRFDSMIHHHHHTLKPNF